MLPDTRFSTATRTTMPRHHVFFSYARKDNLPPPVGEADPPGWITGFATAMRDRYRRLTGRELRIFIDEQSIDDGRDWRRELGAGLRETQLLIAFVSPHYLASPHCRWEWEQYVRREHSAARGDDGIVQVHLVEPADMPGADRFGPDSGERAVLDDLGRRQRLRGDCGLAPWWREGPAVLAEVLDAMERSEAVKAAPRDLGADRRPLVERLRALDLHLAWRLDRITLADLAPGNVARSHSHFVGRHRELRTLHDVMMTGAAGGRIGGRSVIAAAHGLGGLGKTALARQYAYAYADHYASGGMWELPCEGVEHLGRVLLRLAEDERFRQLGAEVGLPFVLSEAVRSDDDLALGAVLAQLQRVAERRVEHLLATLREHPERHTPASAEADAALRARLAPRVLLILDNVDQPALLSAEALARLPQAPWLELLLTTRRDPQTDLGGGDDWHAAIEVGVLPADDALVLMREYQPGQRFRTTDDDDAARQIVERLGGYTLAVELVAAYLGQKARLGFGPADYLRRLDAAGPTDVDRLGRDAGTAQQIRHGEKQVRQVIAWSIDRLSPAARTALAFACRLMPDEIPLDWLQALTAARLPDVLEEHDGLPSPWAEVWAELHGLRLLHPADGEDDEGDGRTLPRMVRIHRMVAATLCEQTAADEDHLKAWIESFMEKLGTVFEQQVGQSQDNALRRLHPTLRDQTTYLIKKYPTAVLLRQAGAAANFEGEHGTIRLAIEITEKVVAGFDALLRAKPDSAQAARDVSVSLNKLADFLRARGQAGDAEQALRYFQRSLQVSEDLLRANPDSAQAARDVSVSLNKLADFLRARGQAGDAEQALRYFQRCLQILEDLLRANPDSAQAARDLAISLERLAGMASQSDDPADRERGLAQQLRAVEIYRGLVARQGESYFFVRTLAVGLYLGAMYALQLGRQGEVQELLREMVALLVDWQQRGGTLDPQMAGLLEQLTGGAG